MSETEVNEINFIIKKRAYRYVAAAKEEWLYPEKIIPTRNWRKLGRGYLLFPDPRSVSFSKGTILGYDDGSIIATDEYGRTPWESEYGDAERREEEWNTFMAFRGEYARVFGPTRRGVSLEFGESDISEDSPQAHDLNLEMERKFKPRYARRRG